jgi:H+/Cl- antiporter ClcA
MPNSHPYITALNNFIKWTLLCGIIGITVGSTTALFLSSLDFVTLYREQHAWIIYSLPIVGLLIGLSYYYLGKESIKGNNLLLEVHQSPNARIPFLMAPLVFIATLLTHLAGGSAGREGTAVQMGGAIADQFTKWFKLNELERKTIVIIGISAGFAAVFGTPLAGAIFALEIMSLRRIHIRSILPSFAAAYIAHYTCLAWHIEHTNYTLTILNRFELKHIGWAAFTGIIFGLTALAFTWLGKGWKQVFNLISYAPFRPFIGGVLIIIFIQLFDATKFIGLGIPSIVASFTTQAGPYDFLIKLVLTTMTLNAGFKGGEVTPLFFIGATLGSALIMFIPLPLAILAAMGFVAVFAGATHCVIASIVMGIEIFGLQAGLYVGIASIFAYFSSGIEGIYSAQEKIGTKYEMYSYIKKVFSL